jgi:peptide/nickel transport system ATP-binding protein
MNQNNQTATDILVSIQNLTVDFKTDSGKVSAVKNISFDIPRGKTVGLVGESGSGKSVTSLAIMGLIPNPPGKISSGKIIFEGEDLLKKSDSEMRKIRGNNISMIFQEPMTSLNPVFTVGNQIDEAIILHQGKSKSDARKRTIELLSEVGIPTPEVKVNAYPHEMSGGQKQRVMIAMAMACEPKLLICDEPTTALDVTIQKQVLELMFELQRKRNMSMLFITHDLAVIADIADDVIVMYQGNLVEKNKTKEIFLKPQHPYTRGLMACRPGVDTNPKRLLTVSDFLTEDGKEKTRIAPGKIEVKEEKKPDNVKYPTLLEVNGLSKHFPIKGGIFGRTVNWFKAVDNVSFKIGRGRTLGLVGESGCGKTTLGRAILRLIEPTEGEVKYNGIDVTKLAPKEMRELRKKMQIIFQDPYSSLNPRMTIGEILTEPMVIHSIGQNKKERYEMASELLKRVGLPGNHLLRYPHEFSGGQRQRICIARALALKPEFIICDESVSALDVSVQAQVLNLLLDLQDEFNLTYIFISHDLSVVKFISDEIGVMHAGKIVEYGSANNIYHHPQVDYTKKLLEAIPKGVPKGLSPEQVAAYRF